MRRNSSNTKGFGVTGVLIVVAALVVIGSAGAYVYHQNHKTKTANRNNNTANTESTTNTTKTATAPDPYAGWSSYTTKYDKLSFKYPSGWTLADESTTSDTDVTSGQDSVSLTSNDGLQVTVGTGSTMYDGGDSSVKVLSAVPVKMLGGNNYLTFISRDDTTDTRGALITTISALPSVSNLPASKNVHLSSNPGLPAPFDIIGLGYKDKASHPVSTFQQDPNYNTALEILESISY